MKQVYYEGKSYPAWTWLVVGVPIMLLIGVPAIFFTGLRYGGSVQYAWRHAREAVKEVQQIWKDRR